MGSSRVAQRDAPFLGIHHPRLFVLFMLSCMSVGFTWLFSCPELHFPPSVSEKASPKHQNTVQIQPQPHDKHFLLYDHSMCCLCHFRTNIISIYCYLCLFLLSLPSPSYALECVLFWFFRSVSFTLFF